MSWREEFAGHSTVNLDKSGPEFAVGQVYGIRAWNLDEYSRLRGISFAATPFRPGVNVARCGGHDRGARLKNHNMLECTCGYYAYFSESSDDVRFIGEVYGVVRGTGQVVVGEKGFRAEKAEVVALVAEGRTELNFFTKLARGLLPTNSWGANKRDFKKYGPGILSYRDSLGIGSMLASIVGIVGLFFLPAVLADQAPFLLWLATAVIGLVGGYIQADFETVQNSWRRATGEPRWGTPPDLDSAAARLKAIYPNVPIFRTRSAMLKQFPLTKAETFAEPAPPPSPPPPARMTPENTPNFWEL